MQTAWPRSAQRHRPRGAARHSKTGFDSDKRNACGYSWSAAFPSGSANARYLGFDFGFLARQASKTPGGRSCVASRNRSRKTTAPGLRTYGSGLLWNVGYGGYLWSSSLAGTRGHSLDFGSSWLNPQLNNYRADGLPLRCLQE